MNSLITKNFLFAILMLIAGLIAGYYIGLTASWRLGGTGSLKDTAYLLSFETAKRYVNNYGPRADFVNQFRGGRARFVRNPRSIWFPASRMKKMLYQIEKEGGNGIRFYFATYDSTYANYDPDGQEPPPDTTFWGRNTLLFVSTKRADTINQDYFPQPEKGEHNGFIIVPVREKEYENNGEMCPPPSNCNAKGAFLLDTAGMPFPKRPEDDTVSNH